MGIPLSEQWTAWQESQQIRNSAGRPTFERTFFEHLEGDLAIQREAQAHITEGRAATRADAMQLIARDHAETYEEIRRHLRKKPR
ncbi:MAG: hypothetical protein PHW10_02190 [Candidatus Peribacteraceae bacterium]|nr:hypothetical protein [Candidatus Peribacteraceae bacterium]